MAIHKRRDESGRVAARLLLESTEPVELPPAEIVEQDASVEREEFRQYLPELFDALEEGGWVDPAPMVQSDSIFVIEGVTRTFWVRVWHTDESRTRIARLHVLSCLPLAPSVKINIGDHQL
ncbi:MAG: hypothetical protein ACREAM_21085 [Blastocatellia bacterium]